MRDVAIGLLAVLLCATPACAKRVKMDWKSTGVAGQYRCQIPPDWLSMPASDGGTRYGDGLVWISVSRKTGSEAEVLAAVPGDKPAPAGAAKTAAGAARLFQRQYEQVLRGEESSGPASSWVYEELALVPAGPNAFWLLRWRSSSPIYQDQPRGRDVWLRFLGGFRPLPPPAKG
ncbi:MAG: hypothetical protein PHF00_06475 [Elusimicrobia bacterium]|nr:hypothetical protein [Elusimicrobiota bacterium]